MSISLQSMWCVPYALACEGIKPFASEDGDTQRDCYGEAGANHKLGFPIQRSPIGVEHYWHQIVNVLKLQCLERQHLNNDAASKRSRRPFDLDAYVHDVQTKPCFLCEIVAKNPEYAHHLIYEDDVAIAFLNNYPVLYGYTLVAPREHRAQVTGDFSVDEYLALQRIVYRIAEAVRVETEAERVYILSLGSQQGNSHVHWHIAPLPPGVPFEEQQMAALDVGKGILDLTDEEMADLTDRLKWRLAGSPAFD